MTIFLISHGEKLESFKKGKGYARLTTCGNDTTSNSRDYIALYKVYLSN